MLNSPLLCVAVREITGCDVLTVDSQNTATDGAQAGAKDETPSEGEPASGEKGVNESGEKGGSGVDGSGKGEL